MSQDIGDREDTAIAAVVRAVSDESLRGSKHPSNDDLLAYHEQALSSAAAEGIRDHVAMCPECAQRGLDLVAFSRSNAADEDDRPTDQAVKAGWRALRSALREEDILDRTEGSPPSWFARFDGELLGSLRFAYALAGVLFLTTLSTSVWLVKELRTVTALLRPAPFQHVGLRPDTIQRDPLSASGEEIQVTDDDLAFSLSFLSDPQADGGLFRARLFDLRHPDAPRWTVEPMERDSDGFFSLKVAGRSMPVGRYEIRIYTLGDDVLAEYSFQIVAPPTSGRLDRHEDRDDP